MDASTQTEHETEPFVTDAIQDELQQIDIDLDDLIADLRIDTLKLMIKYHEEGKEINETDAACGAILAEKRIMDGTHVIRLSMFEIATLVINSLSS